MRFLIGLTSDSLTEMPFCDNTGIDRKRKQAIIEKENKQGDLYVTVRSRQKLRFTLSFRKKDLTEFGTIIAFCNKAQFYYVRIINHDGVILFNDFCYLSCDDDEVVWDDYKVNFKVDFKQR